MNRVQRYHRGRGLFVSGLALWLCASGCRLNNPAFWLDPTGVRNQGDRGEDTQSGGEQDTAAEAGTRDPPAGTSGQATQVLSSGSTTSPGIPATHGTTTLSSSNPSSGSTVTFSGTSAASNYCNRGSIFCYPFTESIGQHAQVHDASGRNNHLTLQGGEPGAGITEGIEPLSSVDEEFKRALYVTPQGSATAASAFSYTNETAGFDLWFKPDDPVSNGWAIFELNDVLALYRRTDGHYACASKQPNSALTEASLPAHNNHTFIHIACSIRNGIVHIQVNGGDINPSHHQAHFWASQATLLFGKPGSVLATATLGTQREYKGRIALLRVWDDMTAMDSATSKDTSDGCGMTNSC